MATFLVGKGDFARPVRFDRTHGKLGEAAGQSFKVGAVLVLSGGKLTKGVTGSKLNIPGIAAEAASGVTDDKRLIYLADENAEFVMRVADTQALALAQIGTSYGLVLDATNDIFRVDTTDTTNVAVKVVELLDAVGDVNGRVVVKFLNASRLPQAS